MEKLKEAYEYKKKVITDGIEGIGKSLEKESEFDEVRINEDNTLYLESNSGLEKIKELLTLGAKEAWLNSSFGIPASMIFNTLPLNTNSCIVKA